MSRLKTTVLMMILPLALAACVAQPNSGPSSSRSTAVDLEAVLPPQSLLQEDTVAALTHDRNLSRLAYVGVWAKDADSCAMMDQTQFDGFAVITPDSIRQSGGVCSVTPGEPGNADVSLNATCGAKGKKTTTRTIHLRLIDNRTMLITDPAGAPGRGMVRCRLQK